MNLPAAARRHISKWTLTDSSSCSVSLQSETQRTKMHLAEHLLKVCVSVWILMYVALFDKSLFYCFISFLCFISLAPYNLAKCYFCCRLLFTAFPRIPLGNLCWRTIMQHPGFLWFSAHRKVCFTVQLWIMWQISCFAVTLIRSYRLKYLNSV